MKKFICLLLVITLAVGGFIISAFAEDGSADISTDTPPAVSEAPSEGGSSDSSDAPSSSDAPPVQSQEPSGGDEPSSTEPSTDSSDSSDSREEAKVEVNTIGSGAADYNDSATYHVGDTLKLNLSPADDYGVKAITVNGEEFTAFTVTGGMVEIPLEGDTKVEVEFAETVKVLIGWGDGGTVTVDKYDSIRNNKNFPVIKGSKLTVSIRVNPNQAIDSVVDDDEDVTSKVRNGRYVIESVDENHVIDISFRETGDTDVEMYTVTVNVEGKGTVDPDGSVQVEHGEDLILGITPAKGYVVQSVSERGNTYKVNGNTYTVKNVYEDFTVTVIFVDPDADNSSQPDNSTQPEVGDKDYITRAEIEKLAAEDDIRIDISSKTKVGKDALERINSLIKEGKTVAIGVAGGYWWMLPKDAVFATSALSDDGINFGLSVNAGSLSGEMKQLIESKAEANKYNHVYNVTLERHSSTALPEGTKLKVYTGDSFTPGMALDWLKYDPTAKKFSQMCDTEGALVKVDNSRYATVEMPFPERYGMLVNYIEKQSTLTVSWNNSQCALSVLGDISLSADGLSTNVISWKSGNDVYITVNLKDGFVIKEISSPDFADMLLLSNGRDVTASGAKDMDESVTIKIVGVSKNGSIVVTTDEAEKVASKKNGMVPWDIIILIVVVVIAMVAGGVVFVIKWRQSDDDDDDDDYEYEEDEE